MTTGIRDQTNHLQEKAGKVVEEEEEESLTEKGAEKCSYTWPQVRGRKKTTLYFAISFL